MTTLEILTVINAEDALIAEAVRGVLPQIAAAVELVVERLRRGGHVIYVGAGTSGRIGMLDAVEWTATFGTPPELVGTILAGGAQATLASASDLEDDASLGARDLESHQVGAADVVIGIAASGNTPYFVGALEAAREAGAGTVAICCNPGQPLEKLADVAIVVVVGPEVLTGSTRMKAGTAQKMVLNMISTTAMVRLGKVYSNLMVDLHPGNAKLRRRAQAIVAVAAEIPLADAARYLQAAEDRVKAAIVMARTGSNLSTALAKLERADGNVRDALKSAP
jgi:N-acetylmuramic acid 6-phosphate etherase